MPEKNKNKKKNTNTLATASAGSYGVEGAYCYNLQAGFYGVLTYTASCFGTTRGETALTAAELKDLLWQPTRKDH